MGDFGAEGAENFFKFQKVEGGSGPFEFSEGGSLGGGEGGGGRRPPETSCTCMALLQTRD